MHTLRLSVRQFLEAVGDDNRFYTSRALNKAFTDVTAEDCISHYVKHTPIGMTVHGYTVWPAQPPGDMAQMYEGNLSERL